MASHRNHVVLPRNLEALAAFFLWRFWLCSRLVSKGRECESRVCIRAGALGCCEEVEEAGTVAKGTFNTRMTQPSFFGEAAIRQREPWHGGELQQLLRSQCSFNFNTCPLSPFHPAHCAAMFLTPAAESNVPPPPRACMPREAGTAPCSSWCPTPRAAG